MKKINWKKYTVQLDEPLVNALKLINQGGLGMVFVTDAKFKLKGTITDGDVRRGLLKKETANSSVQTIMNSTPLIITPQDEKGLIFLKAKEKEIKYIPQIDDDGKILDILDTEYFNKSDFENPVIIMAGGIGSRLGELTKLCPKPMLKIEDKPILEIIISNLKGHGFKNFFISVNYLSEVIQNYFKDGVHLGVNIKYIEEEKKLGTAGALSLFKKSFLTNKLPVIIVNGDLLTKVNFSNLLQFHNEKKTIATMCTKEYEVQIPYGVIDVDNGNIAKVDEKPVHSFNVNAGSYVFSPEAFDYIPFNTYFDMNEVFNLFIQNNEKTSAYPISEYWIDIGHQNDFKKAQIEFSREFI
ncbi:nucleotidyltransferase family protein [Bacteriovoracales bacterium]|nr:nucleotidyltransferase family protein [Bacteriovoracales bacterium]